MYEYEVRQVKVFESSSTDEAREELQGEANNMAENGYRLVQVVAMPNTDVFGLYEREKKNPPTPSASTPPAQRIASVKRQDGR